MPDLPSKITVRKSGEVIIIGFLDRHILDEANIQKIGREINTVLAVEVMPKVVVDFGQVEHLSSAALGTLLTVNNDIRKKDGQLRLTNISSNILDIFRITKLDKLFSIEKSMKSAIGSLT